MTEKLTSTQLHLHNTAHLGDSIWQMHYNNKLLASRPDLVINYYTRREYFAELGCALYPDVRDRVVFRELGERPENSVSTWINTDKAFFRRHYQDLVKPVVLEDFYVVWYQHLSRLLGVESPINNKDDMVFDNPAIQQDNPLSGSSDFLVVNAFPMSAQYNYHKRRWDSFIRKLSKQYQVVTTEKLNRGLFAPFRQEVPCTRDHGLSLTQIASLAINAKKIIAVHSAPLILTFNRQALADQTKEWYIFHYESSYGYSENCHWCENQDIYCLKRFLD